MELPEEVKKVPVKERCKIATITAIMKAIEFCDGALDQFFIELGKLIGIELDNPLSEKCELILEHGITKDVCTNIRKAMEWKMCKAWKELFELEKKGEPITYDKLGEFLSKAHKELEAVCYEKYGITI
ncbi:MAG TPA: hypothetical protein ENG16_02520 [Archaeoglobus sp.]|nr:hypothetical protein [Archaeoglobus sp.]